MSAPGPSSSPHPSSSSAPLPDVSRLSLTPVSAPSGPKPSLGPLLLGLEPSGLDAPLLERIAAALPSSTPREQGGLAALLNRMTLERIPPVPSLLRAYRRSLDDPRCVSNMASERFDEKSKKRTDPLWPLDLQLVRAANGKKAGGSSGGGGGGARPARSRGCAALCP
jgi:hypothetical protein